MKILTRGTVTIVTGLVLARVSTLRYPACTDAAPGHDPEVPPIMKNAGHLEKPRSAAVAFSCDS